MLQTHTAIFYTHNEIDELVLKASLNYFKNMVFAKNLPLKTKGIVVSCKPVTFLLEMEEDMSLITNVIAPESIRNLGHLSIIEKITLGMDCFPSDFVSLHEHDVLYPQDYLVICQELLLEHTNLFDYAVYNRILGVNRTGYVDRIMNDFPLSCTSYSSEVLKSHLLAKRQEIQKNGGWCYLEPGYGGSNGDHLKRLIMGAACVHPLIHINMNNTSNNHHFTNHYLTYEPISDRGFTEWPGNLSHLFT
ncbi:hypothetical protein [Dyadobacter alkalitolerans]|uniref:hypothetical protein n=1 Tax=Dyadobacter alkalitolerans TaxID=492736 RepID=UPI00041C81A1|nr:hypothetical protein [Dyadobacter alkalitolerans]